MKNTSVWPRYTAEQLEAAAGFAEGYRAFISENKTERECVDAMVALAEAKGYRSLESYRACGEPLVPGSKVYRVNHGKTLMLVQVGESPMSQGANILGAHIDSPRLDVKQNPLEEQKGIATFDLHYYGDIKKYQWLALPLSLRGVVCTADGTKVQLRLGDGPGDPVFCITDLLPHLADAQMEKKAKDLIAGEKLDLVVANRPADDAQATDGNGRVCEHVRVLLARELGVDERDLLRAELEVVPAGEARDCGLDRSMVLGYGQDDRVCAYPSLLAQLDEEAPERTSITLLVDKEEIGSRGATSMASNFFEDTVAEVMDLCGEGGYLALRRCLRESRMLSSDVSAGYDPKFPEAFEEKNACFLGFGVTFNKFTGSGGKFGSNDADAEYVAEVMGVMDEAGVSYQMCELGGVDVGGGGTIAHLMAAYGMNVIDCGVPVLSMHAPWELTSKADLYEAYRAYRAFLR